MTINKYLQQISPEDLAYVKRYHHEIQPFRVLPSSTLEFDGQFNGGGETIFTEINLNEDHTIDDMFCTCGAGSLCVHLAAMMYDSLVIAECRVDDLSVTTSQEHQHHGDNEEDRRKHTKSSLSFHLTYPPQQYR